MKKLTIEQLEIILQEYCIKNKLKYREISYEPKYKWIKFCYTRVEKGGYFDNNINENYCMSLDDDHRFISVKRGLTKQLMEVKVLDVEKISKSQVHFNFG